jgi:hypothetical protein
MTRQRRPADAQAVGVGAALRRPAPDRVDGGERHDAPASTATIMMAVIMIVAPAPDITLGTVFPKVTVWGVP